MSGYTDYIKRDKKPSIESLYDDMRARKNKDFFWPTGTQVYIGRQGSGKTISAVKHLIDIKKRYPKAVVVSNLQLNVLEGKRAYNKHELAVVMTTFDTTSDYILFENMEQLSFLLTNVNNGRKGVIYLIDEIHTYFNSLDSKNIPMFVFTEISQQRKQRKLIIGTSQLFMRMAKPLREQADNMIFCKTYLGVFTTQVAFDGMTLTSDDDGNLYGDIKKRGWFFHTRKLREAFDTYQKVISADLQFEETKNFTVSEKKQLSMFGRR